MIPTSNSPAWRNEYGHRHNNGEHQRSVAAFPGWQVSLLGSEQLKDSRSGFAAGWLWIAMQWLPRTTSWRTSCYIAGALSAMSSPALHLLFIRFSYTTCLGP